MRRTSLPSFARSALLIGALAASLPLATLGAKLLFSERDPDDDGVPLRPASPAGATAEEHRFRVSALEGAVETFHKGQWYRVQAGDLIGLEDVLRTRVGSRAILRRAGVELEIRPNVDVRMDALAERTARFNLLRGGNVSAQVKGAGETVAIAARHTETQNVGAARFVVSLGVEGRVDVAASDGQARFTAAGQSVAVSAGQESSALPGQVPRPPESLPDELFLSVFWPEPGAIEASTPPGRAPPQIRGAVRPSTRVRVNGAEAPLSRDGAFAVPVDLAPGDNRVSVEAEDIVGRTRSETRVVHKPAKPVAAPTLEHEPEEIWKK